MGISFRRGPDGEPGRGLIYQGLSERWMKGALEVKRLSMGAL